jgi:hypothetical protein
VCNFYLLGDINKNSVLCVPLSCHLCPMSVNILSFSLYCYYMFQPNWPSSGVQDTQIKQLDKQLKLESKATM